MNSIVSHIYISECFNSIVDSLIEEGYDLSSYTEQELYEVYIQESAQDLHEALPLVLAAPALANPATWAAGAGLVAGIGYAGKKAWDAWRQRRSGWNQSAMDNIQWRDSSSSKPKPKPAPVVKSDSSQGELNLFPGSRLKPNPQPAQTAQPAAAATGGPPPEPPKKDDKPEEPKTEKPKSNFNPQLRNKIRQQQASQQARSDATNRFFKGLQRYNQSPVKKGADIGTAMGRLRTGLAALKNVVIGKTGAGTVTRGISALGPGVADEIRTGGVIRTGITQGLQTSLQKSRAEGEKEKERIKAREEKKREDYARSQQQTGGGWSSVPSRTPQ